LGAAVLIDFEAGGARLARMGYRGAQSHCTARLHASAILRRVEHAPKEYR